MQIEFHPSRRATLGVEMELQLVDATTRQLTSRSSQVLDDLAATAGGGGYPKAKHELLESTIEIVTGICETVGEARADLEATLADVSRAAARYHVELLCAGTHPFSHYRDQQVTPDERYGRLVEEMRWMAERLQIFGIHVHVGVRSAEKAIAIAGALSAYIPHFLAVSASSPYWIGKDTGLASSRSKVFEGLPTAGVPLDLADWADFEAFMTTLIGSGSIGSVREVWWDIRPHPGFGTVELRICDGLPRLSEVAAVAALAQCLVEWLDARLDDGETLGAPRQWVVRQNKWRAARHGVEAGIIADDAGTVRPVREALAELVDDLAPVARRLGCPDELAFVGAMVEEGPSYLRQRRLVAAGASLQEVVGALVEELRTDRAVPAGPPGAA